MSFRGELRYIPKDGYKGDYIPCGYTKSHITFARKLHNSQFTDLIGCLKHNGKGMRLECEKLFLPGEYCVTSWKKAAKETRSVGLVNINPCRVGALVIAVVVPSVTRLVSMEADGAPFTLHPSLCQCSVLRVFKAIATRIRGKSKQTLKSPSIEPGTSCSESHSLTKWATPPPQP